VAVTTTGCVVLSDDRACFGGSQRSATIFLGSAYSTTDTSFFEVQTIDEFGVLRQDQHNLSLCGPFAHMAEHIIFCVCMCMEWVCACVFVRQKSIMYDCSNYRLYEKLLLGCFSSSFDKSG